MNWTQLFLKLFGRTELFGINLGFWVAMGICLLMVVSMNLVFWGIKPGSKRKILEIMTDGQLHKMQLPRLIRESMKFFMLLHELPASQGECVFHFS